MSSYDHERRKRYDGQRDRREYQKDRDDRSRRRESSRRSEERERSTRHSDRYENTKSNRSYGGEREGNSYAESSYGQERSSTNHRNAPVDQGRHQEEPNPKTQAAWDPVKEAEQDPTWARIYISNLPDDTTTEELQEMFGAIGIVAREKQKRGYKDQWPFKIKLYTDDDGAFKGDAVLTFEDANAARTAPNFFNGHEIRGKCIKVELAGKPEPPAGGWNGPSGGNGGAPRRGGGGGGRNGGGGNREYRARGAGQNQRHRPY